MKAKTNSANHSMLKFTAAVLLIVVLTVSLLLQGSISGRYIYYIKVDGRTRMAYTRETNVDNILSEGGYTLGEYDFYRVESRGEDSYTIRVIRGIPFTLHADGTTRTVSSEEGKTYAEALAEAGIPLGAEDITSIDMNETVSYGTEVTIQRVTYEMRPVDEPIAHGAVYEPTRYLPEGQTKVISVGSDGIKTTYYKDKLIDGVVVESSYDHEAVTKKPVNAQTQIGDADAPIDYIQPPADFQLDENGIPTSYSKVITGKGTAYSASSGAWGASGRYLHTGYVAVDPSIIPYGSRLYIRSTDGSYVYGYAIAADTGTALLDGRVLVDVYFNNYSDACKFGAKKVDVYVLD